MRLKKPRVYQPDFEQLLVRSELLKDSIAAQLAGEFYTTRALMPHAQREPECTLAVVPYQQTELHTAAAQVEFPEPKEVDLLEQYYRMPGRQLLVPVNSQRHLPGRNGFLPDEDKLILEAVAAHLPVQTIATLLPRHSITAIKRQAKAVRASAGREPQSQAAKPSAASQEPTPSASAAPGATTSSRRTAQVNPYVVHREGGDAKIVLKGNLPQPPRGFTGMAAHNLASLAGVSFFEVALIPDPDEPSHVFTFDTSEPTHCACFNIGLGQDGSPLISWSDLYAIYMLPDGSKWAEHGYFFDMDDLRSHAAAAGKSWEELMAGRKLQPQELLKNNSRYHTRLINIEYECWIYRESIPEVWHIDGSWSPDAYFWTICFDPSTMREVQV